MIDQGLYQNLQKQYAYQNSGTIPSTHRNTTKGTDDDDDDNTAQIALLSIFIPLGCCMGTLCIVCVIITTLMCLKRRNPDYAEI